MKRLGKWLVGGGAALALLLITPIAYIEGGCRSAGLPAATPFVSRLPAKDHRPFARSLLIYPEWHIVYAADSLGRHLTAGKPPSAYQYLSDVRSFWTGYCAVNRATAGDAAAGDAKVMIYTIGISFTTEMLVKSLWENVIGRASEWVGGWQSPDDHYAARVQTRYGAFMHDTPWYRFPFASVFGGLWTLGSAGHGARHLERQLALGAEYGVKSGYAGLIDRASGAALGRDEVTLRYVQRSNPSVAAIVLEAPRYERFTQLLKRAAQELSPPVIEDIAGNDRIFVTVLQPATIPPPSGTLLTMPLGDRPGWRRVGFIVPVRQLLTSMKAITAAGGEVEHVYDY